MRFTFPIARLTSLALLPLTSATIIAAVIAAGPMRAQEEVPVAAVRAINLARTYVVDLNGGLQAYRPAPCMFATAASDNPCLVISDQNGFMYRFLGGPPAWDERDLPATLETEILIAPDGRSVKEVLYNGSPRYTPK